MTSLRRACVRARVCMCVRLHTCACVRMRCVRVRVRVRVCVCVLRACVCVCVRENICVYSCASCVRVCAYTACTCACARSVFSCVFMCAPVCACTLEPSADFCRNLQHVGCARLDQVRAAQAYTSSLLAYSLLAYVRAGVAWGACAACLHTHVWGGGGTALQSPPLCMHMRESRRALHVHYARLHCLQNYAYLPLQHCLGLHALAQLRAYMRMCARARARACVCVCVCVCVTHLCVCDRCTACFRCTTASCLFARRTASMLCVLPPLSARVYMCVCCSRALHARVCAYAAALHIYACIA